MAADWKLSLPLFRQAGQKRTLDISEFAETFSLSATV